MSSRAIMDANKIFVAEINVLSPPARELMSE
jgi:hypothetical protein